MHEHAYGTAQAAGDDSLITVVSVPAGHPYVARATAAPGIEVRPDPPVPGAAVGVWWPPVALDPAWIRAHRHDASVLHIHFGTESFPPGHLTACIDAARDVGWAVVFTAHDLENPQLLGQDRYRAQLDELVSGADAVVTLTPGAAREIRDRWEREALVIPHPSIWRLDERGPRVLARRRPTIGVHLKDLRPNVDGPSTVRLLTGAADRLRRDGRRVGVEVRLHHRVRDEQARDEIRRLCDDADGVVLIEHERLSDAELAVALSTLDVCVLPYRHGTHSGWLELCWDLGVPVAAPAVGHYGDQHDDGTVAVFAPGDPGSLATALAALLDDPGATRPGSPARGALVGARRLVREESDAAVAAAHASLYRDLVEGVRR